MMMNKVNSFNIFKQISRIFFLLICFFSIVFADENKNLKIFYTTSINGVFKYDGWVNKDKGGLVNLVHYAKNNINRKKSIFIDSGNFFSSVSDSIRNKYQLKLLNMLNYDCINLGEQEIIYIDSILNHNLNIISLNGIKKSIKPYSIIEKNGLKIGIIGSLDFLKARNVTNNFCTEIGISQIKEIISDLKSKCDLIIFLSQLNPENEGKIFMEIPEIDIFISGKTRQQFADSFGNRIYASSGVNCNSIGCLVVKFDENNEVIKSFNIFDTLSDRLVKEDEEALQIFNEFKKSKKIKIKKDCE